MLTIIIPTYDRLPYLKKAINSVFCQIYRHFQLIIVDDGSTDGTAIMFKN